MSDRTMPSHHGYKERKNDRYANDIMKLLMERASCRNFADRKIPKEVLDSVLDVGTHAATGGNLQPYSIIKIESLAMRKRLAEMCHQDFIAKASVSLVFCIDWHRLQRWAELEVAPFSAMSSFRHFWISFQDTIICAQNICTAADALGLGSVYIGTIMEFFRETRDMFELPKGVLPVVLLCIGYPKSKLMIRRKLGRDLIVHDEKYRELEDEKLKKGFDEKYHHVKIEITDERLNRMSDVCTNVHGSDFAGKCIEHIKSMGYINAAQRYFGLHYQADLMPEDNEEFVAITKELGFNWFEKYEQER